MNNGREFQTEGPILEKHGWLSSGAIICVTNAYSDEINENIMSLRTSTEEKEHKSCRRKPVTLTRGI